MTLESILSLVLLLLGFGFLVANLRVAIDLWSYLRRRPRALLVWPPPRPPFYSMLIAIGVALGLLIAYNLALGQVDSMVLFGEGMMFLYYAAGVPLARRIKRGFYADGIWAERGFIRYASIDGISWRDADSDGGNATLLLISRFKNFARRLGVPGPSQGAARRLLRDKIRAHDIRYRGPGLDLGGHDEREDV
ncbi:MAG: hypothetical protein ACE148_10235 [Vicinamibacterales bacterium]